MQVLQTPPLHPISHCWGSKANKVRPASLKVHATGFHFSFMKQDWYSNLHVHFSFPSKMPVLNGEMWVWVLAWAWIFRFQHVAVFSFLPSFISLPYQSTNKLSRTANAQTICICHTYLLHFPYLSTSSWSSSVSMPLWPYMKIKFSEKWYQTGEQNDNYHHTMFDGNCLKVCAEANVLVLYLFSIKSLKWGCLPWTTQFFSKQQ